MYTTRTIYMYVCMYIMSGLSVYSDTVLTVSMRSHTCTTYYILCIILYILCIYTAQHMYIAGCTILIYIYIYISAYVYIYLSPRSIYTIIHVCSSMILWYAFTSNTKLCPVNSNSTSIHICVLSILYKYLHWSHY